MQEFVRWKGVTARVLRWGTVPGREDYKMQQFRFPVRKNTPQSLRYTFRDQDGAPVDLSAYLSVSLLMKLQGAAMQTAVAQFDPFTPRDSLGKVRCDGVAFATEGVWAAQFVATDAAGKPVYGDPLQLKVVVNLDDLILDQLPIY